MLVFLTSGPGPISWTLTCFMVDYDSSVGNTLYPHIKTASLLFTTYVVDPHLTCLSVTKAVLITYVVDPH